MFSFHDRVNKRSNYKQNTKIKLREAADAMVNNKLFGLWNVDEY